MPQGEGVVRRCLRNGADGEEDEEENEDDEGQDLPIDLP